MLKSNPNSIIRKFFKKIDLSILRFELASAVYFGSVFLLTILTAASGADGAKYFEWSYFIFHRDVQTFSNYPAHDVTGNPIILWSSGPGDITANLSKMLLRSNVLSPTSVGQILGLANLWLFYRCLRSTKKLEQRHRLIISSVALVATPLGFYYNKFSTEGFSILFVLCILYVLLNVDVNSKTQAFYFSIAAYFLLQIRLQYLPVIICLAILLILKLHELGASGAKKLWSTIWLISLLATCLYQQVRLNFAQFNQVFGGYSTKDDSFQFLNLEKLRFSEVFFSPWHGLLPYHPIVLILLSATLVSIIYSMQKNLWYLSLCSLFGLTIFAYFSVLQASWFMWWMGVGTFGARLFCVPILILAFVLCLNYEGLPSAQLKTGAARLYGLCSIFLIVLQFYGLVLLNLGITNFMHYQEFLASVINIRPILDIVALLSFSFAVYRGTRGKISVLTTFAYFIPNLLLLWSLIENGLSPDLVTKMTTFSLSAFSIFCLVRYLPTARFILLLSVTLTSWMLVGSILNYQWVTRQFLENNLVTAGSRSAIDCAEFRASLDEYEVYPGLESEKSRFRLFLNSSGCL